MKWFKHMSTSHNHPQLNKLIDKFGHVGYACYWMIVERIALNVEELDEESAMFGQYSLENWARFVRISPKKFQNILKFLETVGLIFLKFNENYVEIGIPNLSKIADEYTSRKSQKSGVSPDSVPTVSRADKNRLDKIREEENRNTPPIIPPGNPNKPTGEVDPALTALARKKDQAEELYNLYPKHVGKAAAVAAILQAIGKTDFETLRSAVAEYADSAYVQTAGAHLIPNPERWFKEERWNDDRSVWTQKRGDNGVVKPPERTLEHYSTEDKIKKYGHLFKVYEWTEDGPRVKDTSGQAGETGVKAPYKPVKAGKIAK